ncbi:MAG: methionyl-tRNA formyltransferase [Planctomycetes bacterium]|nr:methionyl-tRNA formyltransferase [Planctomycetota bacterium]
MRIVFCGSGQVATATLAALRGAEHGLELVLTQPPRPAGRGGKVTPTPVAEAAEALGLRALPCANINEPSEVERIRSVRPEAIVVVDFGQKIGREVRDLAVHGAINMHASLLPALRGAAPINWAIIRGLHHTGVTTFRLVDRMDAGPILLQEAVEIGHEETAEALRDRLAALGAQVVLRTLAGLDGGTLCDQPQNEDLATTAPKLTKADGRIDFADSALSVVNRIRGTWPWPGAHAAFVHDGRPPVRVIIAEAAAMLTGEPNPAAPGTVGDDGAVQTPDGAVAVRRLKVAGKRLMGWNDFVNGYRVAPGDRFETVEGD